MEPRGGTPNSLGPAPQFTDGQIETERREGLSLDPKDSGAQVFLPIWLLCDPRQGSASLWALTFPSASPRSSVLVHRGSLSCLPASGRAWALSSSTAPHPPCQTQRKRGGGRGQLQPSLLASTLLAPTPLGAVPRPVTPGPAQLQWVSGPHSHPPTPPPPRR